MTTEMLTATFIVDTTPLERRALEHAAARLGAPSIEQLLFTYVRTNLDAAVEDYVRAMMRHAQIEAMRGTSLNQTSPVGDTAGGD